MSGTEIFVDTNILIYLLKGDNTVSNILAGKKVYISFITEFELIGYPKLTPEGEREINLLLESCYITPISEDIKKSYVNIRRGYKTKLADAIVAASAITLNLPLLTADQGFSTITDLNVLLYELYP